MMINPELVQLGVPVLPHLVWSGIQKIPAEIDPRSRGTVHQLHVQVLVYLCCGGQLMIIATISAGIFWIPDHGRWGTTRLSSAQLGSVGTALRRNHAANIYIHTRIYERRRYRNTNIIYNSSPINKPTTEPQLNLFMHDYPHPVPNLYQ